MFTEALWNDFVEQEKNNYVKKNGKNKYLKKGYIHFDHRFWFPDRNKELQTLLQNKLKTHNKSLNRTEWWAFNPFLKILIKTPRYKYQESEGHHDLETKIRPICFASHMDSLILGYYSFALTRVYENYIKANAFDQCVLAYRSDLGKCNIQFSKEIFDDVKTRGECTAIALDIKGYFDNIDHEILKEKWGKVIGGKLPEDQYKIFKALSQYSYVNKNSIYRKYNISEKELKKRKAFPQTLLELIPGTKDFEKFNHLRSDRLITINAAKNKKTKRPIGIPQGSALSALLSNIYLIDYDKKMNERAKAEGFLYKRYCDDILIVCETEKANELKGFAITEIESYGLCIQDKKVEMIDFLMNSKHKIRSFRRDKLKPKAVIKPNPRNELRYYKNLQYLGFEFNGENIFIRPSSLSRFFRKMKARIVKTVSMAYSKSSKSQNIFKKQLFERYSHLGQRNFISYALNASKEKYENSNHEWKIGMDSLSIKKQISRHFSVILKTLDDKNMHRFLWKKKKGKAPINPKTI